LCFSHAFITFSNIAEATKFVKLSQNISLGGNILNIQWSHQSTKTARKCTT